MEISLTSSDGVVNIFLAENVKCRCRCCRNLKVEQNEWKFSTFLFLSGLTNWVSVVTSKLFFKWKRKFLIWEQCYEKHFVKNYLIWDWGGWGVHLWPKWLLGCCEKVILILYILALGEGGGGVHQQPKWKDLTLLEALI